MTEFDREEYERRKRAIFEAMSKRGRERILKIGYENWDPFQEPKDPRERLVSTSAQQATLMLKEFLEATDMKEYVNSYYGELFELLKGFLDGNSRCRVIFSLCQWYYSKKHNLNSPL